MNLEDRSNGKGARTERGGAATYVLLASVLLLLAAGGAFLLYGPPIERGAAGPPEPLYHTLDSNLIVNFEGGGRVRYLQLGVELMTLDPKGPDALQAHAPVLRNNLIMMLSDYGYDDLVTREGKETLREAALEEVRAVMEERHGSPVVETLYFTSFVMQ